MFDKIFYKLSKKASRKNLEKNITKSIYKIKNNNKIIKALNIGSGGEIYNLLRKHLENIYSIDIDKERKPDQVIDLCEENFISNLNYKPNLVCCFEVLEHTSNPVNAINNIYKLLKKGDYCLLSVPFNFHIHDDPYDFYRFTFYGLKMLFKDFSQAKIIRRNGWLESIFVNIIRLGTEKNILSRVVGKTFTLLYFMLLPIILIIQIIVPSERLTTGYYVEAKK